MRVLVTYHSKTGNTAKIAKAIQQYDEAWDICAISEVETTAYDLIFVGGWIDKGTFNKETTAFIQTLSNQKIAFFFTLGAYPTSAHAFDCIVSIRKIIAETGNELLAHYHCQSPVDPKLLDWMKGLPEGDPHRPDQYGLKRWANASTHPNQEDVDAAQNFANFTVKKYREAEARDEHV